MALYSQVPAIVCGVLFGIPCICHIRGIKKLTRRERIFSKYVDLFICVSYAAKESLIKQGIDSKNIVVVYDGLDLESFAGSCSDGFLKEELGLEKSIKIVGLISRFTKGKGIEYFIKAARHIKDSYKPVKFVIVGDITDNSKKYMLPDLKELVRKLKMENDLFFLGWRRDLPKVYKSLDVVVNSSYLRESFGMTNVEAMAAEVPVVSTDIGGYKEVVLDGANGFLVPPKSSKSIAEKTIALLTDRNLSEKMGQEGKRRVEEFFDIRKNVKKIEIIYSKFMENLV